MSNSLKIGIWVKILKEEIEKLGLPCIWHSQVDIETNGVIRAIKNRYRAGEGQNLFAGFNEKCYLKYCCE
jgi:hypothetical protein